jgi:hypothetical protein
VVREANRAPHPTGALAGARASESGIFSGVREGNIDAPYYLILLAEQLLPFFE